MISTLRSYFDTQVKAVDPDVEAWSDDLFGNNDLNKPQSDKYYNLIIGKCLGDRDGNSNWEAYDVSLDIFSLEARDRMTVFDAVYEKAILIKNTLICRLTYVNILNDIEFIDAEPIEDEDNDNSVKIRLNFIVRFNYTL